MKILYTFVSVFVALLSLGVAFVIAQEFIVNTALFSVDRRGWSFWAVQTLLITVLVLLVQCVITWQAFKQYIMVARGIVPRDRLSDSSAAMILLSGFLLIAGGLTIGAQEGLDSLSYFFVILPLCALLVLLSLVLQYVHHRRYRIR